MDRAPSNSGAHAPHKHALGERPALSSAVSGGTSSKDSRLSGSTRPNFSSTSGAPSIQSKQDNPVLAAQGRCTAGTRGVRQKAAPLHIRAQEGEREAVETHPHAFKGSTADPGRERCESGGEQEA